MKGFGSIGFDYNTKQCIVKIKHRPPPNEPPSQAATHDIQRLFLGDKIIEVPVSVLKRAGWRRA